MAVTCQSVLSAKTVNRKSLSGSVSEELRFYVDDIDQWKKDFLNQSEDAQTFLYQATKAKKSIFELKKRPKDSLAFISALHNFKKSEIDQLTPSQKINILKFFALWRHVPHESSLKRLESSIKKDIKFWSDSDFFYFGFIRKLSPMKFSPSFLKAHQTELAAKFEILSAKTKVISLTGELYHNTFIQSDTLRTYLSSARKALYEISNEDSSFFALLKDFYRALLYLSIKQTSFFTSEIQELISTIELRLNTNGRTLTNGASILKRKPPSLGKDRIAIESEIDLTFSSPTKIYEYSNSLQPGFFDPVDTFYPDIELIFEWDGRLHYHIPLKLDGSINMDHNFFVLRPMDQIKDESLTLQGYKVLRVSLFEKFDPKAFDFHKFLESTKP